MSRTTYFEGIKIETVSLYMLDQGELFRIPGTLEPRRKVTKQGMYSACESLFSGSIAQISALALVTKVREIKLAPRRTQHELPLEDRVDCY